MRLTIDLSPSEEAQISEFAKQIGLVPSELVTKLVKEHLPFVRAKEEEELDAKLRKWQEQDNTKLMPDISTEVLFAQWAEEDTAMTEAEREAEDRLWEDLEKGLAETSPALQLRQLR